MSASAIIFKIFDGMYLLNLDSKPRALEQSLSRSSQCCFTMLLLMFSSTWTPRSFTHGSCLMILSLMDKLSDGADLTFCRLPIRILFVLSALRTRRFFEMPFLSRIEMQRN
jgi:hypothetical protein